MNEPIRKKITIADVTPEFVLENVNKLVWLRDDWLCMRDICKNDGDGLWELAEHCAKVKEDLRKQGHIFDC